MIICWFCLAPTTVDVTFANKQYFPVPFPATARVAIGALSQDPAPELRSSRFWDSVIGAWAFQQLLNLTPSWTHSISERL